MAVHENGDTHVRDGSDEEEDSIEIQRSFLIPADCDVRLKPYGARILVDEQYVDGYYDRQDYILSLNGVSLRFRSGEWELKHVEGKEAKASTSSVLTHPEHIVEFLNSRSYLHGHLNGAGLKEALENEGFQVFVRSTCSRKVYGLPENEGSLPAKITLEHVAELDLHTGEIEVSADSKAQIPLALSTIDKLAKNLGLKSMTSSAPQESDL
ncbi:hypothetical protein RvY_08168 [Ramazzottius varieornatus]|uniref:CYTH domain-containing protein n=1 Tax=Ramazzottius varieornatus TaxID=947166 RepID=A0A1D1VAL8_RAMVA|nr:hypothetical protein RvY_08168 [Ramazzottius varieornatus]